MFPGGPDESGPAAAGTLFCKPDAIQADASRSLKSFSYKPRTRPDSLFDERSLSSALRNEAAAFGELDVAGSELPAGADGDSRRMARARKIMDAIRIRSYPVHPALTPFLKCVWSLESDGPIRETTRERILPDSCMELVFHFADPFRSHFANGESAFQPRSFVVGQMKRFLEIEPAGRAGFVAVRFVARGAYLFFHRPLSEVAAGVVDLEDLWSDRAGEWTERVALARDMATRVRLIEEALLGLLRENGRTDPAVDRALQLIETSGGQIRVAELAAGIGGELPASHPVVSTCGGPESKGIRARQPVSVRAQASRRRQPSFADGRRARLWLLRPGALQP